jgi:hypothetical protein
LNALIESECTALAVERHWWNKPVPIHLRVGGASIQNVSNALQAAELLLNRWPIDGRKALAARRACLQVLEGVRKAEVARNAFEAAAAEADILLPDD